MPYLTQVDRFTQYRSRFALQQGLSITGGGLPLFDTAVVGLQTIRLIFDQEMNSDRLTDYSSSTSNGYPSIDASNRYFTPKQDISNDDHLQYPKTVDPRGILGSIAGNDLVYAPENVVEYYKVTDDRFGLLPISFNY